MTKTITLTCDICKQPVDEHAAISIELENGYRNVDYHAHADCLEKIGLPFNRKPPELIVDQTWLTGEDGTKAPPFKIIAHGDTSEGPKQDLECPKCDSTFTIPANEDAKDAKCPACGFEYIDELDEPHVGSPVT